MDNAVAIGRKKKKPGLFEKRIHEIDFARGVLIILVLMDHLFWALSFFPLLWYNAYHVEFFRMVSEIFSFYWQANARSVVRELCLFGFVTLSGISCAFSRNNWKRSAQLLLLWAALVVLSNLLQGFINQSGSGSGQTFNVNFNVIGVLAFCTMIYCFIQDKGYKTQIAAMLICFLFMYIVILPMWEAVKVPWTNPANGEETYAAAVYMPVFWGDPFYATADWMPLFPYIVGFFGGAAISKTVYKDKKSIFPRRFEFERPFCFVGRNTLLIYFTHEPLILIIFYGISFIAGVL